MLKIAGGFFAISTAASLLQRAGSAVLTFSANLEQSRIAFTTLLGSAEAATDHLKELQQFALKTPFEFAGLVDASKRMQAMGFSAKQVIPILNDVGNAVAAIGGNTQVLDRVILALSQTQAKGRVAAQEMNQLAEAGIPAWRILSEAIGKSRAETIKLAEEGKISSQVFLDAFQKFSKANFGGLMEKQSRTFQGALSNIKDTLLQTAGTAFEPLFQKISEIADRMAQELQSGKPTVEASFKIMLDGLVEMAGAAGGSIADALINRITDPRRWAIFQDDPFFIDRALRGIVGGMGDVEDLFGLGNVPRNAIPAVKVPDLRSPLPTLTNQQKDNSEAVKKATGVYEDLSLKLRFYGQDTEVAATKQRLLAIGTEALTSAEGRRAVQLAQLIDKQRISTALDESQRKLTSDLADVTENKYKAAFESLFQARQDARMAVMDLSAAERDGLTPLERFNFGLGAQVEGMLNVAQASAFTADQMNILRMGLLNTRQAMLDLTLAQEQNKRKQDIKQLGEKRTDLLRSLAGVRVDLDRELRKAPSDEIQRLAERLEGLSFLKISPGGLDLFVEKLRSGSVDAQVAVAEIQTAISGALGDLGSELPGVTNRIVNLFLKAKDLNDLFAREDATAKYKQALSSLADVIQEDIRLTNAQTIEKLLLTDAYKGLTEGQEESLRAMARQADLAQILRERQQDLREVAEDIGFIFGDVFDSIGGDWRDMWRDMLRTAKNIGNQIIQELLTALASKAFNIPFESRSGGIVGMLTRGILGSGSPKSQSLPGIGGLGGALAGARAGGGPVEMGKLYRVNENRTEYFRPNVGGQVIPIAPAQAQTSQLRQETIRITVVDDMRSARETNAHQVMRLNKRNRKLGQLIPGF